MLGRDATIDAFERVSPSVRQTDHAERHLVADLDRRNHFADLGPHARAPAVSEAETRGIVWMHEQRAAFRPLHQRGDVVEPRVLRTELSPADQLNAVSPRAEHLAQARNVRDEQPFFPTGLDAADAGDAVDFSWHRVG